MGTLQYNGTIVEFDDRLLAHLQIVIVQKISRGESFLMSWGDSAETGDGHSAIWIHPTHNLYFTFTGGRNPTINRTWLSDAHELSQQRARPPGHRGARRDRRARRRPSSVATRAAPRPAPATTESGNPIAHPRSSG